MDLYLIRHGDPNYQNDCLTEKGKLQAQKLAEYIKRFPCDEVYSSPMGRAKETASYSCTTLGKDFEILPWLHELEWGDKSGDAYSTSSPWTISDRIIEEDKAYPLNESWKTDSRYANDRIVSDVEKRNTELDNFLESKGYKREGLLYKPVLPNDKSIMMFCHGGIISATVSHLLNISFCHLISNLPVHLTSITKISLPSETGPAKLQFILPPEIY